MFAGRTVTCRACRGRVAVRASWHPRRDTVWATHPSHNDHVYFSFYFFRLRIQSAFTARLAQDHTHMGAVKNTYVAMRLPTSGRGELGWTALRWNC
jgi:hypothetical protein